MATMTDVLCRDIHRLLWVGSVYELEDGKILRVWYFASGGR
jgi:hypothetical protein